MIKRIIKSFFLRIYKIGFYEMQRRQAEERMSRLSKIANLHPTVFLSEEASLYNGSRPKDKINIGANSRIMGQLFVFDNDGEISIGEDCFVGPLTKIWSAKKISIGNRVLIAHNVNIHDNISHPLDAQERYEENYRFIKSGVHAEVDIKGAEIIIGDDVWIGFNAMIMRGVTIGNGAVIGAGAVVTGDVEPWTVNVGNPLRCVRRLDPVDVIKNND